MCCADNDDCVRRSASPNVHVVERHRHRHFCKHSGSFSIFLLSSFFRVVVRLAFHLFRAHSHQQPRLSSFSERKANLRSRFRICSSTMCRVAQACGGYLVGSDSTLTAIDHLNEPLHYYCYYCYYAERSSVGTVAAPSPNAHLHKAETFAFHAVLHGGIDARYGAGAAATIAVNSARASFSFIFPFLFFSISISGCSCANNGALCASYFNVSFVILSIRFSRRLLCRPDSLY